MAIIVLLELGERHKILLMIQPGKEKDF